MSPDVPKNREPTPAIDTTAADKAQADAEQMARRKKGKSATVLTTRAGAKLASPTGATLGESGQAQPTTLGVR